MLDEPNIKKNIFLLLVLVCSCSYFNTLNGEWVWDDASSVLLHKHVHSPSNFFQLFREDQHAFGRGQGNFYRPLVSASFMLDYWLSGGPKPGTYDSAKGPDVSPLLFHITNIVWHVIAAYFFFLLLNLCGAPLLVQIVVPLIFSVHPLHTEAVAYISGRADMMSASFMFAALCLILRGKNSETWPLFVIGAMLCFVAGLCSKESSLIFPFLLSSVFLTGLKNTDYHTQSDYVPLRFYRLYAWLLSMGILGFYLVLRATVLKFAEVHTAHTSSLWQRLIESAQALGMYVRLLFIPTNLHMERTLESVPHYYIWIGIVFLLFLVGAITFAFYTNNRRIAVGFLWFIVTWLPISGVFPLNAPMAEHWMYVPMAGFWWGVMESLHVLLRPPAMRTLIGVGSVAYCILFMGMTARRNLDWHDNVRLFESTLRQNPMSARVHFNLAVTYEDFKKNYTGARRHYELFLDLRAKERQKLPKEQSYIAEDEIEARFALGRVLMQLQDYKKAAEEFALLLPLSQTNGWKSTAALAAFHAGQAMLALGEVVEANTFFEQAVLWEPQLLGEVDQCLAGKPFYEGY